MRTSLLYPDGKKSTVPKISVAATEHLRLTPLLQAFIYRKDTTPRRSIFSYLTADPNVIAARQEVLTDLLQNEPLVTLLDEMHFDFLAVEELLSSYRSNTLEKNLYTIREILLLIACVDRLNACFASLEKPVSSKGLSLYAQRIAEFAQSAEYANLKKNCQTFEQDVGNIKSVTIGANLNARLQFEEAGVVAVNDQHFKSGHIGAKLFRMDFGSKDFQTLEPITPMPLGRETDQASAAVLQALNKVFERFSSSFARAIRALAVSHVDKIPIFGDISFFLGAVSLVKQLHAAGLAMSPPKIAEDGKTRLNGLYNPSLFLSGKAKASEIVANSIEFDENAKLYILTGPNNSGKTVFLQAAGIAQFLFQLGSYVPAISAEMAPASGILTYFSDVEDESFGAGKFAKECESMKTLLEKTDENTLVLLNEPFTSTNFAEGTALAETVLRLLSQAGARGILVTHFHELTQTAAEINKTAQKSDSLVENLTAEAVAAEPESGLQRSFRIRKGAADYRGLAKEIAAKYGIDESLLAKGG